MFNLGQVVSLLFNVGMVLLNLLALGVATGYITHWAVQRKPTWMPTWYVKFLLRFVVVIVATLDILLVFEFAD
jgi:hypothetical protein